MTCARRDKPIKKTYREFLGKDGMIAASVMQYRGYRSIPGTKKVKSVVYWEAFDWRRGERGVHTNNETDAILEAKAILSKAEGE